MGKSNYQVNVTQFNRNNLEKLSIYASNCTYIFVYISTYLSEWKKLYQFCKDSSPMHAILGLAK